MTSISVPWSVVVSISLAGPVIIALQCTILSYHHERAAMQLEHTDLLVQVESLMNQSTAQTDDATDAHSASARRLDQLWTVGTTVGVGCFTIADHATSNDYDVGTAACNSLNCPSCFITPALSQDSALIIDSCDSHYWGITGTTPRSGVWMYTFINIDTNNKLTVSTKNAGSAIAGNTFTVPALSSITAYCQSAGATGLLYFPSTTLPQLTVEGAATLSSTLAVSGTSTLSGAVGLSGALTMSGTNGIVMNGGALTVGSNGNFQQTGTGTFSTGTGAVSLNGHVTVLSTKNVALSGGGDITIGGTGNFVMGTGSISTSPAPGPIIFASDVTLASNKGLTLAGSGGITYAPSSSGAFDMSGSSGAFTSGTGTVSLKGATTVATGKTLNTPTLSLNSASVTCDYVDIITGTPSTAGNNLCTDSGR